MEKQINIAEEIGMRLSQIVSPLIGHTIGTEHIHTDINGWFYYIPEQSLQPKHPLILNHYRGPLFMVVPTEDWIAMENGDISAQEYVDTSYWNFGYFWGGGSLLGGVQWQPFEDGTGIHETEKISRYLSILSCRTHLRLSGYMPSDQKCRACAVDRCPFSPLEEKKTGASWDNEPQEKDDRVEFYKAVKARVEKEFGFKVTACLNHSCDTIAVSPQFGRGEVRIDLPENLLIDMQYNPGKYDVDEQANNMDIVAAIPWHKDKNGDIVLTKHLPVPEGAGADFFLQTWKENNCCNRWFQEETVSETEPDTSAVSTGNDIGFVGKLFQFFRNLF